MVSLPPTEDRRRDMTLIALCATVFVATHVAADELDRYQAETVPVAPKAVVAVQEVRPVENLVETIIETYPVPLDEELQLFIVQECEKVNIAPEVIFAVIQKESSFRADVVGDNGKPCRHGG